MLSAPLQACCKIGYNWRPVTFCHSLVKYCEAATAELPRWTAYINREWNFRNLKAASGVTLASSSLSISLAGGFEFQACTASAAEAVLNLRNDSGRAVGLQDLRTSETYGRAAFINPGESY